MENMSPFFISGEHQCVVLCEKRALRLFTARSPQLEIFSRSNHVLRKVFTGKRSPTAARFTLYTCFDLGLIERFSRVKSKWNLWQGQGLLVQSLVRSLERLWFDEVQMLWWGCEPAQLTGSLHRRFWNSPWIISSLLTQRLCNADTKKDPSLSDGVIVPLLCVVFRQQTGTSVPVARFVTPERTPCKNVLPKKNLLKHGIT